MMRQHLAIQGNARHFILKDQKIRLLLFVIPVFRQDTRGKLPQLRGYKLKVTGNPLRYLPVTNSPLRGLSGVA